MSHQDIIRDQFSRQAVPFSEARSMTDSNAIKLLIDAAQAGPEHRSLDVACGPGMVVLAFAGVVREAVGLDTTQAMLDRARVLQQQQSRGNAAWVLGDAGALPFPDAHFDIVTCRFAIHHMTHPTEALAEMVRVTRPGGRMVICDGTASDDPVKADAFNQFERLRDPSTVRFLTTTQLRDLVTKTGLKIESGRSYRVPGELKGLMRTSFPAPADIQKVRDLLAASVVGDALGLATKADRDRIIFSYPALILGAQVPHPK
jgi:ubiquinone/menaquinone biosynthesis C-methylase UbiE